MNMISTGTFLTEMDASDKQENSLVNKLVSAWERKNSRTARAGGVSLMALSLAACGSSDDTSDVVSYTQAQYDAAKVAATAAAEAVAATATTAAAAAAATSQAAAVAAVDTSADDADAISLALRNAAEEGGVATYDGQSDAALLAAIKTSDNSDAIAEAVVALGATDASGAAITTLAALGAAYDDAANPSIVNFSLTSNTDTFSTGSIANTITGATASLDNSDSVVDAGGIDTFKYSVELTADKSVAPNFTGVEVFKVTNSSATSTDGISLNMISSSGVTDVMTYLSSADVSFNNLAANAAVTIDGTTAGIVTVDFQNSVVVGAADVATVTITGGATASELNIGDDADEFETINITSSGSGKNTITDIQDGAAAALGETSKVVIGGSAQLTLGEFEMKDAGEIDASSATGKILLTPDATVDKITGGSAADTVTLTVGDLGSSNAAKTIDLAGGEDTVSIAANLAAADFTSTLSGKHVIKAEIVDADVTLAADGVGVGTTDANRSVDVANVTGITKVTGTLTNSGDANDTADIDFDVTGLSSGNTVDVSATKGTNAGAIVEVAMSLENASGASDALTFDGDGDVGELAMVNTADDATTVGTTETGDVETLTISSSDVTAAGVAKTLTIASLVGDDLTTVNIVGSNAITLSALDLVQGSGNNSAGTTTANRAIESVAINAGTSSGAVTITNAEANVLAITGGSGVMDVDLGTTGTVKDVITGGSGSSDKLTLHDAASTAVTFKVTSSAVEIVELETITSGNDTFSMENMAGVSRIEIADNVTGGGFGTTVSNINGQTVAVMSNAGTSTDFSAAALVLKGASGVTNVNVEIDNSLTSKAEDAAALDGLVISTDTGGLTINDSALDANATSGGNDFEDQVYEVAGTAATAKLTTLKVSGGGDTDTTTAAMDANTHTITASTQVNLSSIDATGMIANLNMTALTVNAGATVNLGTAATTTTTTAAQLLADAVKFVDAGGADSLTATGMGAVAAHRINSNGIETLNLAYNDDAGVLAGNTIDFRDTVGVTDVNMTIAAAAVVAKGTNDEAMTLSNLASGATVSLGGTDTNGTLYGTAVGDLLTIDAAVSAASVLTVDNGGAAGEVTIFNLTAGATYTDVTIHQVADQDTDITTLAGTGMTTLNLGAAKSLANGTVIADADYGIATVTLGELTTLSIDASAGDIVFGNTALTAAKLVTLDIIGDEDLTIGGASGSVTTKLADVNGANSTSAITFGGSVDFAAGADIDLGTGNDTITLSINTNTSTALSMGEKASDTDTLNLVGSANMGNTVIDLSATDQMSQINGATNSSVQDGIENIDLSALTGSNGAFITGTEEINIISGTINTDNITLTETTQAIDQVKYSLSQTGGEHNDTDVITGFSAGSGGDVLQLTATSATLSFEADSGAAVDLTSTDIGATNYFSTDAKSLAAATGGTTNAATQVIIEVEAAVKTLSAGTVAGFRASLGEASSTALDFAANDDFGGVVIAYDGTGTDADAFLFYVNTKTAAGTDDEIETGDTVTLIAQLVDVGADTITADNFL
jgi:hypothetical protein